MTVAPNQTRPRPLETRLPELSMHINFEKKMELGNASKLSQKSEKDEKC